MQTLAAKYMLALVGEFSSTSKSAVAIGLPLEFHRQAHKGFTEFGLLQVQTHLVFSYKLS